MATIKLRRGTAAAWTAANPVLADGEVGVESAAGVVPDKAKIGDGVTTWNALPYSVDVGAVGGEAHPDLAAHDTLGLATQSELDTHTADTTAVHGIADTSVLATNASVTAAHALVDHEGLPGVPDIGAYQALAGKVLDVAAPLLTVHTRGDLTTVAWTGQDDATGTMYGVVIANGHFATSTDAGATFTDRTFSPSTYFGAGSVTEMIFSTSYMYVIHSTGTLWRAPKDTFNSWTDISVPQRPPFTTGRTGTVTISGDGAVLLACNYNSSPPTPEGAYVYRSTDNGLTWTTAYSLPNAKHSHAVKIDPYNPTHVYYSVGDGGVPDIGLHKSTDLGLTWVLASAPGGNRYGIDMVFPPPVDGVPEMVLLEGDGASEPLLMVHYKGSASLDAAVWFNFPPADTVNCTRGTTRAIGLTPYGDCVFMTTTEGGTVGVKAGIYVAQGPWFTHAVLLQDVTGAEPVGYVRSFTNSAHFINRLIKFNIPRFAR